jgi:hypothetical protein
LSNKEERDLIFISGPYFMGSKGMFLTHWTLDFDLDMEISISPICLRLPHLPIISWDESSLKSIGDKMGQYID